MSTSTVTYTGHNNTEVLAWDDRVQVGASTTVGWLWVPEEHSSTGEGVRVDVGDTISRQEHDGPMTVLKAPAEQ